MGLLSEKSSPSVRTGQLHRRSSSGAALSPAPRSDDRPVKHFTMKTPSRPSAASHHSHSHSHSHSTSQNLRPAKSSTPAASPRMPYSVGQPFPPKASPPVRSATQEKQRVSSPNYFGLVIDQPADLRDSANVPRDNWSPPTSSVKSFGAAIPKHVPLDANPEFEAFRRQADANRGRSGFVLSTSRHGADPQLQTPAALSSQGLHLPQPPVHDSDSASEASISRPAAKNPKNSSIAASGGRLDVDSDEVSLHDSAYVSAESKRNSETSLNPPSFFGVGRRESPASFEPPFNPPRDRRSGLTAVDDRHPRLSLTEGKADRSTPDPAKSRRADTEPLTVEIGGPTMISPAQLRDILVASAQSAAGFLLLDLRVSPQFAQSRIQGALNLCIPTTLLKRATFNLQKLQSTFQSETDQARFANWKKMRCLVVYDAFSSEKRDAVSAVNTIRKFANEGFSGSTHILRGGFHAFAAAYPDLVDQSSASEDPPSLSLGAVSGPANRRPSFAPVIGGVMLPNSSSDHNPFFSNIRQNMDLADGVGQMDVALPSGVDMTALPVWLREASSREDHGKKVSERFLQIELNEQSRMREAYAAVRPASTVSVPRSFGDANKVQLSGLEKGVKNRYKDILPFEHARVKLQGRDHGSCDYVNASHIKATRSHKRYIASQGPLPATFEDFWSVIWDQDVRVIVMLTAESEGGQLKCHPYWKGKDYGPIKLRPLSEKKVSLSIDKYRSTSLAGGVTDTSKFVASQQGTFGFPKTSSHSHGETGRPRANTTTTFESSTPTPLHPPSNGSSVATPRNFFEGNSSNETPYVIIRKFALSHGARPFAPIREITHLHYPSWPDFGAPAQPTHLLALVELADLMQRASLMDTFSPAWSEEPERDAGVRPMLVHCSAGCGRTGTFCTVDSVIDMLKRQRARVKRIANRKNAERERVFAEQRLTEMKARQQHQRAEEPVLDTDGDVEMSESEDSAGMSSCDDTDDGDAISPLASFREPAIPMGGSAAHSSSGGRTPTAGPPPKVSYIATSVNTAAADEEEDQTDDIDLSWLNDDIVDLVATTVSDFRTQRLSMVQSLRQFVLCYESIAEWVWRIQERTSGSLETDAASAAATSADRPRSDSRVSNELHGSGWRRSGSFQLA